MLRPVFRSIGMLVLLAGCSRNAKGPPPRFALRSARETGVAFTNTITITDSLNAATDPYVYNGAGVGVGDIDNDGKPDIFFAGNQVSSRLYLNTGDLRFQDITASAGVTTHCWATGVTLVDINQDGWLDIYVSCSGPDWSKPADRVNLLFINNHDRTFTEQAAKYGIADGGFTTHAVFLDYDGDGDLDLFLLNNSPTDFARGQLAFLPAGARGSTPESYNALYRNNGNGTFTNVSHQAGILEDVGYGLGVAVGDVNGDGWPDVYVSNDITPNDVLYVNQKNGTFKDESGRWLKHSSFAGMGVDMADFNNDGRTDILQVDMMPPAWPGRKRVSLYLSYANLLDLKGRGYRLDYEENSLQLNSGATPSGDVLFSDVARMSGVAYTDWSWAPLFADFDNDGLKDIFVSNGYPKGVNDTDYKLATFGAQRRNDKQRQLDLLRDLRGYALTNYLFRNNGDLTFADVSAAWGMQQAGYHYGAAYADLNGDGKLDLVVNNIDAPAAIYENVGVDSAHYLDVALRGTAPNLQAIGATVTIRAGGKKQYVYHSPYRGYMSTMEGPLHFGLGAATIVDSLTVAWPDGSVDVRTNVRVDTVVVLQRVSGAWCRGTCIPAPDTRHRLFQPFHSLRYKDPAPTSVDFEVQPLLPDQPSRQGPPIATADVNGDGREDVFVGTQLYIQLGNGTFVPTWQTDPAYLNWGAAFLDANGDGKPDLYVASGGYALSPISRLLQDRLYINQGRGRFVLDSSALPPMLTSTMVVAPGPDWLFVGGRLTPRNYPYPTRSYLLQNDGHGHFSDVTASVLPELAGEFGMVTGAVWIDFDGDGKTDLVTAGEWMPLRFFRNDGTRLHEVTAAMGLGGTRGRWYSLAAGDFNHDGRPDLIAGNLGLNYTWTTSPDKPFGIYAENFTASRRTDVVLTEGEHGKDYPIASAAAIGREIYMVNSRFRSFAAFSVASIDDMFDPATIHHALHYQVDTFASLYLENTGHGFRATPLPNLAQVSAVRGVVVSDVDGDGNLDATLAGNLYDTEPNTPRADAGNGLWLKGDGHGHFTAVPPAESGLFAPGYVTGLGLVKMPTGNAVLVANLGDSLSAFVF